MDPPVAPGWILLRQPEDQRCGSLRDAGPTGLAGRVGPALGDKFPVPAQQRLWLNEEAPEPLAGEQSCESRQNRPVGRLQSRSMDLASKDAHLMAQQHDLDSEVRVPAKGDCDELEEAAERPVEEREGRRRDACRVGVWASKSTSKLIDGVLGTDRYCGRRRLRPLGR